MEIVKPHRLRPGDTIGIVSVSSPVSPDVLERTVTYWSSQGYSVELGKHVTADDGYMAGSPEDRVADLMDMFQRSEVSAVVVAMGGKSANQMLPLLDFDVIRSHPKIFMGLSDSSILALAIYARAGLVSFHGPTGVNFGLEGMHAFTERYMVRALTSPDPIGAIEPYSQWTALRGTEQVEGPILGGHLGTIRSLLGTPYAPDWTGAILFVEEVFVEHHDFDAALTHFRLAGVLDQISGLIVGRPLQVTERSFPSKESLEEVVMRVCKGYRFPIVFGVDLGHTPEKITIPIGIPARLETADGARLSLLESGVV